jgi:2-keto-4-pentenoate hydratase
VNKFIYRGRLDPSERNVADALWEAMTAREKIAAPRKLVDVPDLASAYRIQASNVERALADGYEKVGYKIAMTAIAIQKQFGLDHPTSGTLLDRMVLRGEPQVNCSGLSQGRLEGEIAFEMLSSLVDPNVSLDALSLAVGSACPAVEIVNSRIRNWDVTPFDFVADNSAAEYIVLGDAELPFQGLDLSSLQMQIFVNGAVCGRGSGASCLGSPLIALHWLAVHLIELGTPLQAGDIVMAGSLGPALPFSRGDKVEMCIEGAQPVRLSFN